MRHHLSAATAVSVFLVITLMVSGVTAQGTRKTVGSGASAAEEAFNRGDWETAVRYFENLVKTAPGNPDYRLKLGVALLASGRPSDAAVVLGQALKLKPTLAIARHYLG